MKGGIMGGNRDFHSSLTPISTSLVKQGEKEKLAVLLAERKLQCRKERFKTDITDQFSHYFSYLCIHKACFSKDDIKSLTEKQMYMMHVRFARSMKFWAVAGVLFFCTPLFGQIILLLCAMSDDDFPLSWRYLWVTARLKITYGKKWLPFTDIHKYIASVPDIPSPYGMLWE